MMKKMLSSVLALSMLLGLSPMHTFAQELSTSEDVISSVEEITPLTLEESEIYSIDNDTTEIEYSELFEEIGGDENLEVETTASLVTKGTYYFDLSAIASKLTSSTSKIIYSADPTLQLVPFTYAGYIIGYSFDSNYAAITYMAQTNATNKGRYMFVCDYNLSTTTSWSTDLYSTGLLAKGTISTYPSVVIRTPSGGYGSLVGAGTTAWGIGVQAEPTANEWDKLVAAGAVKNFSSLTSITQDTCYRMNNSSGTTITTVATLKKYRAERGGYSTYSGYSGAYVWTANDSTNNYYGGNFRPVLECSTSAIATALVSDTITLNYNGGTFNGSSSINVVRGSTFSAPTSNGVTRPSTATGTYFGWNTKADGSGTTYESGTSIPSTVSILYAQYSQALPKEPTPNLDFNADGTDSGTLSGNEDCPLNTDMEYSIDGGTTWIPVTEDDVNEGEYGEIYIPEGVDATDDIIVVQRGDDTTTKDSDKQTIDVTKPVVDVDVTHETAKKDDGTIGEVDDTMVWRPTPNLDEGEEDDNSGWEDGDADDKTLTGLSPGDYDIYIKPDGNALASDTETVTVEPFVKLTPTVDDLDVTDDDAWKLTGDLTPVDYNAQAHPVPVVEEEGKDLGDITVKYTPVTYDDDGEPVYGETTTTPPVNAGDYLITADTAGSDYYYPATDLELGIFTINKIEYTGKKDAYDVVPTTGITGETVPLPDLPLNAVYGTPVADDTKAIEITNMTIDGTTMTYDSAECLSRDDGLVSIPVTGATNYFDYEVTVTVVATDKLVQHIKFLTDRYYKVYGDDTFTNELATLIEDQEIHGNPVYSSDTPTVATVDDDGIITVIGYGTAIISAVVEENDEYSEVTASYTVNVDKAPVVLQPYDLTIVVGSPLPSNVVLLSDEEPEVSYSYSASGLVHEDVVVTDPVFYVQTDGNTIGDFPITIHSAVITNAGSYNVTYESGALSVVSDAHNVTVNLDGGNATNSGAGEYVYGETVTINAGTRSGYTFKGWTVISGDITLAEPDETTTTFTMPLTDVSVTATWTKESTGGGDLGGGGGTVASTYYDITVILGDNGSISPNGGSNNTVSVKEGNDQTFTMTPDSGYVVADVLVDGESAGAVDSYTFENLSSAHTIEVSFQLACICGDDCDCDDCDGSCADDKDDCTCGDDCDCDDCDGSCADDLDDCTCGDDCGEDGNCDDGCNCGGNCGNPDCTCPKKPTPSLDNGDNGDGSGTHLAYIKGYVDGTVKPENNILREEVSAIFYRLLTDESRDYYMTTDHDFSDVAENRWSVTEIATLAAAGVLYGQPDGSFAPARNITRGEFAAIMSRFADDSTPTIDNAKTFSDIDGHWSEGYINHVSQLGWINGYVDGTFRPDMAITRAEAMTMVNNMLNRHVEDVVDLHEDMIVWPDNTDTAKWSYFAVQEATNSHTYIRKEDGKHEIWTSIISYDIP